MNKAVSIIIPVYNVEKYINKCLDSVIAQTLEDCEIIIVNDGSTDKSREIIREYQNKYPELIVVDKPNGGLASARNAGLSVANGKYVGFIDSDDYIKPEMFETLYNRAEKDKSDIVMCGHIRVFNDGEEYFSYSYDAGKVYSGDDVVKEFLIHKISLSCCDKLFRRELFVNNKIAFPEGMLNEDIQVVFNLILNSTRVSFEKEEFYYYYQRGGSITKRIRVKSVLDMIKAIDNIKNQLIQKGSLEKFEAQFESFYFSYIGTANIMFYQHLLGNGQSEEAVKCKEILKEYNSNIKFSSILSNSYLDRKNKVKSIMLKLGLIGPSVYLKEKLLSRGINN